jgi:hypothetical protein
MLVVPAITKLHLRYEVTGHLALLLALISRWNERKANEPIRGGHCSVRAALCITFVHEAWLK